ncbi:regulator of telomere elongation helicase 1 homolog [Eucalyptus grandis]|uniref:regulator of telomere elongation helicase 1 homolog n=1 Tax=Eucalyptus grandis TaxID=71139 RepID=UPI00192EFE3E|nr:regulator of telomere elongation helicase 1 homolog [Eucalyptus grandis]
MPTYKIRGIDVDFPFDAYDCQLVYMEKVIQALQERCNALLESPTGTGKTLCLLCATLAWRKSLGSFSTGSAKPDSQSNSNVNNFPTIVYASRTHSQLRQVIQELKRSNYRPKMMVLGSREQLCIHDEVSLLRGRAQNNACHYACRKGAKSRCKHYSLVADFVKNSPFLGDDPVDIEDLISIGRKSGPCPYYISRELHKAVDILFAPYNYLIDQSYRKSLSLDWNNSILIFDEAHNLESLCADAASFDLPSGLLTACISEAKSCIDLSVDRRDKSNDTSRNPDNFAILRALLLKLEKRIAEIPVESKEFGFTKPGPYIYELFSELNITHETASMLMGIIEEASVLLEESKELEAKGGICRLETMGEILKLIFREKEHAHSNFYRLHVREVDAYPSDGLKGKALRTLSWWCFNPGLAMEEFSKMGVGSIVLTSGTLSPMDSFAQELNLDFPVRLENPHVISSDQIWAGVVAAGPSGCLFNSSYRNRDSLEYKQELGNAIVNLARIVPDGLLVFFPSYYILDQCLQCWKNMAHPNSVDSNTIWERICKHKQPVVEPRQSSLFPLAIEDYMSKLNDTSNSGALFFAVCRGKVSEGLDFADSAGRAVVVTGLPFATRTDPKVRLKREYLDELARLQKERRILTGDEWYNQQASRAVNQAVGRVIRHRDDYGAIIMLDERFAHPNRQSQISRWIQPHIKCYSKFGEVVYHLTRFFRDGGNRVPAKPKKLQHKDSGDTKIVEPIPFSQTPLALPTDDDGNLHPISLACEMKRTANSSQLREVIPANRSSFSPLKKFLGSMGSSFGNYTSNGQKLLMSGRGNIQQKSEIVDLTADSLVDEKPYKGLTAPRFTKKRKISHLEDCVMLDAGHSSKCTNGAECSQSECRSSCVNLVEWDNSSTSDGRSRKQVQGVSISLPRDDEPIPSIDANPLSEGSKGVQNATAPGKDEENKGSAFLLQVQEKLNSSEYKEFIGFMKALKSKSMKISYVLQSIARLFSGPERLQVSTRFKDFIPVKYHSLYEKYLGANDGIADG